MSASRHPGCPPSWMGPISFHWRLSMKVSNGVEETGGSSEVRCRKRSPQPSQPSLPRSPPAFQRQGAELSNGDWLGATTFFRPLPIGPRAEHDPPLLESHGSFPISAKKGLMAEMTPRVAPQGGRCEVNGVDRDSGLLTLGGFCPCRGCRVGVQG